MSTCVPSSCKTSCPSLLKTLMILECEKSIGDIFLYFMEGTIIYQGKTKTGRDLTIRYVHPSYTPLMLEYINTLSKEQTCIIYQGEQLTMQQEEEFVQSQLQAMKDKKGVMLTAFCDGKYAGNSAIGLQSHIESHIGVFGISLGKEYRGDGIGRTLMQHVISEAEKNLPDLRIITLDVFENNPIARQMYTAFGFKEYEKLPGRVLHKGQYVDHIYMYKEVKK